MMKESELGFRAHSVKNGQLDSLHERNAHLTREVLEKYMRPELINRFDGIIEFQPLSKENLLQIVTLMLDEVNQRLAQNEIHLDVTEKVKEKLVDLGYDPKMGARPLRRTIQDHIEDAITDFYLENPSEKELKAIMTSNGKILIKSAKKAENAESVNSSQEEK